MTPSQHLEVAEGDERNAHAIDEARRLCLTEGVDFELAEKEERKAKRRRSKQ
jgi:hypothetical protein